MNLVVTGVARSLCGSVRLESYGLRRVKAARVSEGLVWSLAKVSHLFATAWTRSTVSNY